MIAANQYADLTNAIVKIVEEHEQNGRWHEAVYTLKMGLKMTRGARHNASYQAHLQARLAGLLLKQGEFGTAMALLRQAKQTADQVDDPALCALTLFYLGELHYVKCFAMLVGNHYQTLDYHCQALQLFIELENFQQVALSLGRIGLIHERLGHESQAAAHYAQALQLSEAINYKRGMARPMARLGAYHQTRCEWLPALRYAQYTLVVRTEAADQEGLIFALHQMAVTTIKVYCQFDKALAYAQQALAIAEELDFKLAIAQTLFLIGQLYDRQGNHHLATEYFLQTAVLADEYHFEALSRPALTKIATMSADYECVN